MKPVSVRTYYLGNRIYIISDGFNVLLKIKLRFNLEIEPTKLGSISPIIV